MKRRLLTGWNLSRVLFVIIGLVLISESFENIYWLGLITGIYFTVMGVFALGCAGNCSVPVESKNTQSKETKLKLEDHG